MITQTLEVMVCFMGLSWCFNDMFSFHASPGTPWNLSFNWTRYDCDSFVNLILPLAVVAAFVFPLVSFALGAWSNQRRLHGTSVLHLVTCLLCLGMTSVPLTTLTLSLRRHPLLAPTRLFAQPWTVTQTYRISNSYGLFRTMTGVGPYKQESLEENTNWGWAGVPPSIVQRPELILEGRRRGAKAEDEEDVNHAWRELKFRWKPGNVVVQPKQVAPHQPRVSLVPYPPGGLSTSLSPKIVFSFLCILNSDPYFSICFFLSFFPLEHQNGSSWIGKCGSPPWAGTIIKILGSFS